MYLPAFQRTGFTELDFILNEDSDGWQMMLDVVGDDLASQGLSLKPGHRMMIMSRLRKAKIEMERDPEESRQRRASPSPAALRKALSSKRDDRDQEAMSAYATFLDGFKPIWDVPILWRIALALAVLTLSLVLWAAYEAGAHQVGSDVAGGWLFVKVLYIFGFVVSGIVAALGAIDAIRMRQADASDAPMSFSMPSWPGVFSCGSLDDMIQCPSCDPGVDCSKFYKIVCCRCSIQID